MRHDTEPQAGSGYADPADRADPQADPLTDPRAQSPTESGRADAQDDDATWVGDEPEAADGSPAVADEPSALAADEADDGEVAESYDEALDAEPVTGLADAMPAAPEPGDTRAADLDSGGGTTGEGTVSDTELVEEVPLDGAPAGEGYAADENRPVVDSFEDETRGSDPYAIPEPADTSARAAGYPAGMMPGDGEATVSAMAVAIPTADAEHLRGRWQQLQLRFVDDPQGTAGEARELVGEVVDTLTTALVSQRDALDDWQGGSGGDTEIFRAAVMRYRDFFDRLLSV